MSQTCAWVKFASQIDWSFFLYFTVQSLSIWLWALGTSQIPKMKRAHKTPAEEQYIHVGAGRLKKRLSDSCSEEGNDDDLSLLILFRYELVSNRSEAVLLMQTLESCGLSKLFVPSNKPKPTRTTNTHCHQSRSQLGWWANWRCAAGWYLRHRLAAGGTAVPGTLGRPVGLFPAEGGNQQGWRAVAAWRSRPRVN